MVRSETVMPAASSALPPHSFPLLRKPCRTAAVTLLPVVEVKVEEEGERIVLENGRLRAELGRDGSLLSLVLKDGQR